jgi:hypothetical protein
MTVAELIEALRAFPSHHPVMVNADFQYDESIGHVGSAQRTLKDGPSVVIRTIADPRNDPEEQRY